MPENVSGFADYAEKTDAFSKIKLALKFNDSGAKSIVRAIVGEGSVIMGDDLSSLLSFAGIKREVMTDSGLAFSRRRTDNGYIYFINNKSDKEFAGTIPLGIAFASAGLFNPMTKEFGTIKSQKNTSGNTEVYLKLNPGESVIVAAYNKKVSGRPYLFFANDSEPVEITGKWKVEFIEGGPELPVSKEISRLVSWTEFESDGVKDFSGTAKYSISFQKPSGKADAWKLDLGKICESARVTLNGKEIAVLIGPDYSVTLNKKDLDETNTLEIRVSNLMANRIAYMDRNKIEWKRFYNINMAARLKENNRNGIFDAADWKPMESGLIGPVTITKMAL